MTAGTLDFRPDAPALPLPVMAASGTENCRVGIDLTLVEDVAGAVATFGDRYLLRIFTEQELSCCTGTSEVAAASLAARFAAKEAAVKVLRPIDPRPPWRSIEVVRDPGGACHLSLTGTARELAAIAGITEITLSMTHEREWAAAVVLAMIPGAAIPCASSGVSDGDASHPWNTNEETEEGT